jgi:hypothetical protein
MQGFYTYLFKLRSDDVDGRAGFDAAGKVGFADIAEGYGAVFKGKKSVIMPQTYVFAGHHGSTALAYYYLASFNNLTGIELNAKIFWL